MKRIFIAMHYLELGGAENALIGLLHALDYTKVSVDLFIYAHRGELMDWIPPQVNLLPEIPSYAMIEAPIKDAVRHGQPGVAAGRIAAKVLNRLRQGKVSGKGASQAIFGYIGSCVTPFLPRIGSGAYDLAVSFLTPHNIVLSKVSARKKICWIHTDYSNIAIDQAWELPVWKRYDRIVSISPDVTRSFLSAFPSLENKICEIHNILPEKIIREKATEGIPPEMQGNGLKLLSIGRFCEPKNFDNIPDMARRLRDDHKIGPFHWFIIGYGGDESLIRRRIAEAGVTDCVTILGKRSNPYPYIAAADLYIQPSRYEGRCVTVREAQLLGRPVAIADYATAPSQVTDGVDGFILPLDNEAFAAGLARIINNPELCAEVAARLAANDYSDRSEAGKLLALMDN